MEKKPQYKVIVSYRARQMLAGHIRFLTKTSTASARRTKGDFIDAIRSLSTMPERFPFLNADFIPHNKYHKMFIEQWYLLIYQIKDQRVYVEYIVDCRQDYGWIVK
jgi:hypothetical protein